MTECQTEARCAWHDVWEVTLKQPDLLAGNHSSPLGNRDSLINNFDSPMGNRNSLMGNLTFRIKHV